MLLRKIKTRGFLGHLGACGASENGKPAFVELDFTNADLSLVHGANGAGKSTVWDALLFAFFKEHRGGGSNFARLIHDRDDEAEISVEFELENQIWEIYSRISKTKRGTANVVRRVCLITDENKLTKCESDDAVDAWVRQNLKMSAQTFTSAVLLRQGEADKFLQTKPKQRKEILLELLQLDFYRKLSDEATKRSNEYKKTAKKLEEELRQIAADAPDQNALDNQQERIEQIEATIQELNRLKTQKQEELGNVREAEKYATEIADIERLQNEDKQLFERAAEIRQKFERLCELETVLLGLEKLWEAKEEFGRERENLQKVRDEIARLEADLKQFSGEASAAEEASKRAQREFNETEDNLRAITTKREDLNEKLRQIVELEKLETDVSEKQKELQPFQTILSNRERIRGNFNRFELLREGKQSLLDLQKAEKNLRTAETQAENLRNESRQKEALKQENALVIEELTERAERLETAKSNVQNELNDCQSDLKLLREKLKNRDSLTGQIECPMCGTSLDEHQAERLADELEQVKHRIGELEMQESTLKTAAAQNQNELAKIKSDKNTRENEAKIIGEELAKITADLEHAAREVEDFRQLLTEAEANAGEMKNQNLADVEAELSALANASRELVQLEDAEKREGNINAVIENLREQASRWNFPLGARVEIRSAAAKCEEDWIAGEESKAKSEFESNRQKQISDDLQQKTSELKWRLTGKNESVTDWQTRSETAWRKVETARNAVVNEKSEFQNACEDKSCFERLLEEKNDLKAFESEKRRVEEAEKRKNRLEGEKIGLQKQLDKIPPEHRRAVQTVEGEFDDLNRRLESENGNSLDARDDLRRMEDRLADYKIMKSESVEADKIARLWHKLADAFGKKGLEARIVQAAQETVKQNANTILESLSGGAFQIELEETSGNTDELQILVRDLNTQNAADKPRPFEFFSGGESLLIAVSLAVAVGQAVTGNTAANTLIIDEGFGALDNNRRELLVEELQRLSCEVLQNGRVIVVSHQDDVKEKFNNRFLISKNADGLTNVEIYGGV